jgi:hypothetical protein
MRYFLVPFCRGVPLWTPASPCEGRATTRVRPYEIRKTCTSQTLHNRKLFRYRAKNTQFCYLLGWTILVSYGIINPISKEIPSLHVETLRRSTRSSLESSASGNEALHSVSFLWRLSGDEVEKHGFSLIGITSCITARRGDGSQ